MVEARVTVGGAYDRAGITVSTGGRGVVAGDLWICETLGGAGPGDAPWLARLRGLALAASALTMALSGWKAIGPLTVSDLLLVATVLLLLPRFAIANARTVWVPGLAVALIAVGGVIGTVATGADVNASAENLVRFVVATFGSLLLVVCWRPGLEQIKSFSWLWIAGGVISALVALLLPDLETFTRPPGLTPHPNHLAIISLILVGVTLGVIAAEPTRNRILLGLAAASILFAAIVASGSRAGLAAALLVVLLALIATRDRTTVAITVGVLVVGVALVLGGAAGEDNALTRLSEGGTERGERREAVNTAGWERFKGDPVTGVGFEQVLEPHNLPLMLGSSAGVLGIIGGAMLIVLALGTYAVAVWKRMAEHPAFGAMLAGLAAAVIGYLAASMFQNVLWDRNVWIAIALMTWAAAAVARDLGQGQGAGRYHVPRPQEPGQASSGAVDDREGQDMRLGL